LWYFHLSSAGLIIQHVASLLGGSIGAFFTYVSQGGDQLAWSPGWSSKWLCCGPEAGLLREKVAGSVLLPQCSVSTAEPTRSSPRMSVKKTGKSRKIKLLAANSRHGGVKNAKRQPPTKKTRTAAKSRASRSAAKAPVKAARKPARVAARSSGKVAASNRAAALARLKKARGTRPAGKLSAKSAAAANRAKHPASRGKPHSAAPSKLRKGAAAARQPASRNETQKVLSERRAHAEAVLALRATTRKLAPKTREPAAAAEKAPKKVAAAAPQPARAPAPGAHTLPPRPFGARPGDIRLPERPGFKPAPKPPGGVKLGFKPAEYIVYPAHGVGQILAIEEQEVAGFKLELFVISFSKDKMILKVPTPKTVSVGMRKLASSDVVKQALTTLTGRARVKRTMWSRRAQEYEAKINSGDLVAIAEVVRDLYRSEAQPEQSYSERQLYEAALDRVAREIAVVQKLTETESLKLIESQLQKGPRRGKAEEGESDAAAADSDEGVEEAA
jgi:CarD family transcriptional regulator